MAPAMPASLRKRKDQERLGRIHLSPEEGALYGVRVVLDEMHPAEIAHLLESLHPERREIVWDRVAHEVEGDVLPQLNDEVREIGRASCRERV